MIVAGKECQDCIYYSQIDKFYSHCSARNKRYHYGQWVPCEDKKPLDVTLPIEVEEAVEDVVKEVEETVVNPAKEESVKKVSKKTRRNARTNRKKGK